MYQISSQNIYTRTTLIFITWLFCLLLLIVSSSTHAQQAPKGSRTDELFQQLLTASRKDGTGANNATRNQYIMDLISVSFSDTLWLQNSLDARAALIPFENHLKRDTNATFENWLTEFTRRANGIPEPDRITKWTTPVRVGLGWPKYGIDNTPDISVDIAQTFSVPIQQHIKDISRAISMPIEFLPPGHADELTRDFARIRIVPVPYTGLNNDYKTLNYDPFRISSHDWYYTINQLYIGAIPFTPYTATQVDGFLLPNGDNSLGLAVCRVLDTLPPQMLHGIIAECMVRALGMPELLRKPDTSILANWNNTNDDGQLVPSKHGRSAISRRNSTRPFSEGNANSDTLQSASQLDLELLAILYCDAIRPGDSKYDVIRALIDNDKCFETIR